jgi:tetratricopeptide (TPR) repeat protein
VFEPLAARSTTESGGHGRRDGVGSVLVGREQELATLVGSLTALCGGHGEIVLLRGEPGVGKSRLLAEARRHDGVARVLCLEGRAISFGRTLSYWPFIEILRAAFGIAEGDAEAEALRKLEAGVGALFDTRAPEIVPYLAAVMSLELSGEYQRRVKYLDAQAMKRQVFLAMRQLFERLAERQPVLIVLEDWHWVDQSSVALCEHLMPLARNQPLSFWLATRSEPAEPAARIKEAVSAIQELSLHEIALTPLPHDHSRALINNLLGAAGLPEPVLNQIERRTEGNPFFMEEVVRGLIADGTLEREAEIGGWRLSTPVANLAIPDTVQGVIVARIDRLEESVKNVLRFASVIGRSFFLRILKAIGEAADKVEQGVGRLEDTELIRLRQQVPEIEYIFRHALVQEAAYGSILAERRRAIHRSVAQAIEQLFADRRDEFVSLLAYHYARAEDWENAYTALLSAGDLAGRIAADAEALELYRQAEAMFMKVASRELTPLQRATMERKVGQAYYGIGDYEQAVSHFSRALAHLGVRYPKTHWGVLRGISSYLSAHFVRTLSPTAALFSRRRLDNDYAREIATICQSLGWLDYFTDEKRLALDTLIELDAGERSGDALARSRGLTGLGIVLMTLGRHGLAHRRMLMANSIAQDANAPEATAFSQFACAWLALATGSLAEADRTFVRAASAYEAIGDLRGRGAAAALRIRALIHRAEFVQARALIEDVVRVGEDAGDPHVMSWGFSRLGNVRLTIGPLDEAERNLERGRALTLHASAHRMHASAGGLLGKCYLRQGRLRSASRILHESMRLIEAKRMSGDLMVADTVTGFAELWLVEAAGLTGLSRRTALRRGDRACAAALRLSRKAAVAWQPEAIRLHGTLAWMCGSRRRAITRWQRSIVAAETMGIPVERARTLLEMGDRLGDVALVDEARAVFQSTGAKVDLAFALHVLARMAAVSDSNAETALALYDQAIAGLSEVKAEARLGLACQERAQLLVQAGRHEEARSDLARARHSFDAVSADEQETAAA